jgi:hypothetical protein
LAENGQFMSLLLAAALKRISLIATGQASASTQIFIDI